jgi:4-amino-4-deoxy-L-arabinose transferase-like glycosyltransferase
MFNFIKRHPLLCLSLLYFLVRLINLTKLAPFNDEAIYLDWGWRELHSPGYLFYSLYDGKQPLLMWVFGLFETFLPNPFWAGRLVSVITGYFTFLGLYRLAILAADKKTALWTALFYIIIPLFVFYDRQALMESALAAVGIWLLYTLFLLHRRLTLKHLFFLSVLLALGVYIKSSAYLYLFLLLPTAGYLTVKLPKPERRNFIAFIIVALLTSQLMLMVLYSQPAFRQTLVTNNRYLQTFQGIQPILTALDIIWWQMTPFIFLAVSTGLYLSLKHPKPRLTVIAIWSLGGLILITLLAKNLSPRYLLPLLPPLTIFAGITCQFLFVRPRAKYLLPLIMIPPLITTLILIFSPLTYFKLLSQITRFSQQDGYVTNWTSGYGAQAAINYLNQETHNQPAIIGIRLDSGNPESTVISAFNKSPRIISAYFDSQLFKEKLDTFDCLKPQAPFYFVSRDYNLGGMDKYLVEVTRSFLPNNQRSVGIYTLKPDCTGSTLPLNLVKSR